MRIRTDNENFSQCISTACNSFQAPLVELIRVPGIGVKSAREIISIRKKMPFTSEQQLKKLGVVVERAKPYIKIDGEYQTTFDF